MNSWCKIISIKETTHCRGHLQGLWKICIWIDCNDKNITILSLSQTGKSIASSVSVTLSCWLRTSFPIALECIDTPAVKNTYQSPSPRVKAIISITIRISLKNSYDSPSSRVLSLKQFLLKKTKDQFPSLRLISHEAISVKTLSPHFTSLIERINTNNYMHHSAL